jgi:radical SAM protein with 4Fe4S-binding SPASM domain
MRPEWTKRISFENVRPLASLFSEDLAIDLGTVNTRVYARDILATTLGIVRGDNGDVHFTEWNCRAGQNNVVIRTDGRIVPCFPMYSATCDWGNIDNPKFDPIQLKCMKQTCQKHCFSTLNHNLGYCYNDARVIKFVWKQAKNRFQGGARSFED